MVKHQKVSECYENDCGFTTFFTYFCFQNYWDLFQAWTNLFHRTQLRDWSGTHKTSSKNQGARPIEKYLEHCFFCSLLAMYFQSKLMIYMLGLLVLFLFDLSIYRSISYLKDILTCNIVYNSSLLNNGKLHFRIFCEQFYKICILWK